jgi:hypothetical protein
VIERYKVEREKAPGKEGEIIDEFKYQADRRKD